VIAVFLMWLSDWFESHQVSTCFRAEYSALIQGSHICILSELNYSKPQTVDGVCLEACVAIIELNVNACHVSSHCCNCIVYCYCLDFIV
jgi:hypothetical protein